MAALALTGCASLFGDDEDERFQVRQSERALVIIGVAEAADATAPRYQVLWRQVDPQTGAFADHGGRRDLEAETNARSTVRVAGIPGEFTVAEIEPGQYALDSVFATEPDGRVMYVAQGLVDGPDRPGFEVAAGEAIYLGIWQTRLDGAHAVARLWRLDGADMRALMRVANPANGRIVVRETHTISVPCAPRRLNTVSSREIC